MQEVTDPAILAQLNGTDKPPIQQLYDPNPEQPFVPPLPGMNGAVAPQLQEVTDPSILQQLEASSAPAQQPQAPAGILGRTGQDIAQAGEKAANLWHQSLSGELNPAMAGTQILGQGINAAFALPGEAISGAYQSLPSAIQKPINSALSAIATPISNAPHALAAMLNNTKTGQAIGNYLASIPNAEKTLGQIGDTAKAAANIALSVPAGKGLKAVASEGASPALSALGKLGEDGKGISVPQLLAKKAPAYDPIKGVAAMADNYATQAKTSGQLYKAVDDIAAGKPINTAGLADDVNGLIDSIKAEPLHEARGVLPKLENLAQKLEPVKTPNPAYPATSSQKYLLSPAKFDLADAVDLKKTMNESFNSARWTQNAKGTVYGNLGAKVGAILDDAAQKWPEFGEAKQLADKYWLNNVQNAFKDNAVLAKYFKVDDLREIQALRDGRVAELHPETLARARATLKNIKTETDLDALRKVLPPEMAKQLSKSVIKAQGSGGRVGSALAAAKDLKTLNVGGVIRNSANVLAGTERTPEQIALIKAAKSPAPKLLSTEELRKLGKNK